MFEVRCHDGICRLRREGTRWLSTGFDGGVHDAPAAYNVTVEEGFSRTDLAAYVAQRLDAAGFDAAGPALLTGVAQRHARRARFGPVEAVVTAGLSNPASLPVRESASRTPGNSSAAVPDDDSPRPGTVNVVLGTTRALDAGALANLLTVAVEAKTATLFELTGFTGTTSDAAVVACDPSGDPATFTGSATTVGHAARVCVRDALRASLASRYPDDGYPASVADAAHGVVTEGEATVSRVTPPDAEAP